MRWRCGACLRLDDESRPHSRHTGTLRDGHHLASLVRLWCQCLGRSVLAARRTTSTRCLGRDGKERTLLPTGGSGPIQGANREQVRDRPLADTARQIVQHGDIGAEKEGDSFPLMVPFSRRFASRPDASLAAARYAAPGFNVMFE